MPAAPGSYSVELIGSEVCGSSTGTFRFTRPGGYTFHPGQHIALTLDTRDGQQTKRFSHADAPLDGAIELTTRLSGSAFKDALLALEPGTAVRMRGPSGRLRVPEGAGSAGFLTGGVGITPVRSIVRDAIARDLPLRIVLFYGNREPGCIPYADELRGYASRRADFTCVEIVEAPDAAWAGPVGYVTADVVRAVVSPPEIDHWIVSGPPAMVDAMGRLVEELGIPADDVSYERFAGY